MSKKKKNEEPEHVCDEHCLLRPDAIELVLSFIGSMLPQLDATPAEAYVALSVIRYGVKTKDNVVVEGIDKEKLYALAVKVADDLCMRIDITAQKQREAEALVDATLNKAGV